MANTPRSKGKKRQEEGIELRPDGWRQFERAVYAAVKSGPKHRVAAKPKKRTTGKGRARVGKARS